MKTRAFMSLAVIATLLSLAMPLPAHAEGTRIYFKGVETGCDDLIPSREWASGPNYHIHVASQTCYETADTPQFTGTDFLYDGVLNLAGGGAILTVTGKFRMETEEGGTWVGSFRLPANTTFITGIGHGEGMYEGQEIHLFLESATETFWGYIDRGG